MKNSKQKQLLAVIEALPAGAVVGIADFTDLAEPKTISKMMERLLKEGKVEKVMRSIYWKPDGIYLQPKPNDVANALARENNWYLAPSGYTALHIMGLENEVPDVWTYVTNGTYRRYTYGSVTISFTHTSGRLLSAMSEKTKLLVQCLKAYGKEHLSDEKLTTLWKKCKDFEWKRILRETKDATAWVGEMVMKMIAVNRGEI